MRTIYAIATIGFSVMVIISWITGKGNLNEYLLLANSYMILFYVYKA